MTYADGYNIRDKDLVSLDQLGNALDNLDGRLDPLETPATFGWIPVTASWTYATATTITVPSGAASLYQVGMPIKLTNSTVKYFYLVGVADTLLTVTGGSDYSLANAAISAVSVGIPGTRPLGFPHVFEYTVSPTGFSVNPEIEGRFSIIGRDVFVAITTTSNGASNATGFTVSLPVTSATITNFQWVGWGTGTDNSAYQNNVLCQLSSNQAAASLNPQGGSANWTASGLKGANVQLHYTI